MLQCESTLFYDDVIERRMAMFCSRDDGPELGAGRDEELCPECPNPDCVACDEYFEAMRVSTTVNEEARAYLNLGR